MHSLVPEVLLASVSCFLIALCLVNLCVQSLYDVVKGLNVRRVMRVPL